MRATLRGKQFGLKAMRARAVSFFLAIILIVASALNIETTNAATSDQVVIASTNAFTSLNPYTPNTNLSINNDIKYLTSTGFNYVDGNGNIVKNEHFGEYEILPPGTEGVPNYRVKYTWSKNAVWSDGVPVTVEDFLLWWLTINSKYSKFIGLGTPGDASSPPAFNSISYGGWEDKFIQGWSRASDFPNQITFSYSTFPTDWEYHTPIPFPVHAIGMYEKGLTISNNDANHLAAATQEKKSFLEAFESNRISTLKRLGNTWSNSYNISRIGSETNPLLLVCNGAYQVNEAGNTPEKNVRLVRNEKYSGTAPKIKEIIFGHYPDGTQAEQALDRGQIDILGLQSTSDGVGKFSNKPGINVVTGDLPYMEHFDIRVGSSSPNWNSAKPLQGSSVQARELRSALLMALPRQEIVDQVIKPVNRLATVPESLLVLPTDSQYAAHVQSSNVGRYSPQLTQATRSALALSLVKKYFPNVASDKPAISVRILYGANNPRRAAVAKLINASLSTAGFQVTEAAEASWSSKLTDPNYDAMFFSWFISPLSFGSQTDSYATSGGNNFIGLSNNSIDGAAKILSTSYSISEKQSALSTIENQVVTVEAASLPLYIQPAAYAVSKSLNNFKLTSNNSYPAIWNFWEWNVGALVTTPTASATPKATPTPTPTPVKPTSPLLIKVSISGGVLTIQMKIDGKSTKAYLFSPGLDILKSQPLEGVIKDGVAIFSKPLTNKFSGQKVTVAAYSAINGIFSESTVEEVQIPNIANSIITPKVTPTPTASKTPTPKATTKKPAPVVTKTPVVMCKKPGQTDRPRIGSECIKGWTEVKR